MKVESGIIGCCAKANENLLMFSAPCMSSLCVGDPDYGSIIYGVWEMVLTNNTFILLDHTILPLKWSFFGNIARGMYE